jgi:hypothetical protein
LANGLSCVTQCAGMVQSVRAHDRAEANRLLIEIRAR